MRLRGKLLRETTPSEIAALVPDEVTESAELDYKEKLPASPAERKEFAQDAAALANTRGGVLLCGITERIENGQKTGIPESIIGVGEVAADHELRRLEQVIRDLTDPALTGCHAQALTMTTGEVVVGIGVPRSLLAPHAVGARYYRRGTTGNYQVGTRELRQMFLERDEWGQETEQFRRSRITTDPLDLQPTEPQLDRSSYLHVLPLGRLREVVDIVAHRAELSELEALARADCESRANIDGYVTYWPRRETCNRYTQWFRFGGIEVCSSRHFFHDNMGRRKLDAARLCSDVVRWTRTALRFMNERLALDPPFVVFISLLGTLHVPIATSGRQSYSDDLDQPNDIDAPHLVLPGAVIQETESDMKAELMPTFDMIWQAAGFDDCLLRRTTQPWGETGIQ